MEHDSKGNVMNFYENRKVAFGTELRARVLDAV